MGRPICRPEHGPSRKAPRADTQVRPYAITAARSRPNGAGRSPPPTGAPPAVRSNGPMYLGHGFRQPNSETEFGASVIGLGPYGEKGKFPQPPGPAAHSGASTPAVARDGRGSEQGSPQRDHQRRTIPQSRLRLTAPFTQGSLGTGMRIATSALRASSQ